MINRRDFLGLTAGAGASLALSPQLLRALQRPSADLVRKAIPSSGELLPAIGLSFSNHPGCADHAALTEVVKAFYDGGGRVYDALHVNPEAEEFHITAATQLGIQDKLFWSTRGTPAGMAPEPGGALVTGHIDSLLARIKVPRLNLVMLPAMADPTHIQALKNEKKAGRVRYIGVQSISANFQSTRILELMRNEPLDFVGVDYDIVNRGVEGSILPLARERKIAVMAFFPFGNAGGLSCTGGTSLFTRVSSTPVPEWAAEFDAATWAQFFAKYVIGHPAVTVARVGTTKTRHMLDNIGGGIGRLPDEATRKRMAAFIDALPALPPQGAQAQKSQAPMGHSAVVLSAATLDRLVGSYRTTGGTSVNVRRYGTTLVVKTDANPDAVIFPLSETRFSAGPNFIDFQRDGSGNVTGLVFEQGDRKVPATRVR